MLDNVYSNKNKCYGCGLCAQVCANKAITMQADEEGFLYPAIDTSKCIECGKCVDRCIIDNNVSTTIQSVYSCSSKDDQVLGLSTSGGIAYVLAKNIIEENGIVYGAAFTDNNEVHHIRVESVEGLGLIQGTKYVQSRIHEILFQIEKDVSFGKKVLFTGTPCQVAAVKKLIGDKENLILMEIVCMGCPSPKIWKEFLVDKSKEIGEIRHVRFRDKEQGWRGSNITYYLDNDKIFAKAYMDEYLMGFGQCLFLRPSCHDCGYKGKHTVGDIKVGDFWGIENGHVQYNKRGTSVVIIETQKGNEAFNKIKDKCMVDKVDYRFAVSSNPCIEISKAPSKNRGAFFDSISQVSHESICKVIKENLDRAFTDEDRYICQYPVVEGLLRLIVNNGGVRAFFERSNYSKIAVYGMSDLGRLFIDIMLSEDITPVCIIDKNSARFSSYKGIPVIGPYQIEEYDYDCIIVALVHLYNSVLETLLGQGIDLDKVISLGSVI